MRHRFRLLALFATASLLGAARAYRAARSLRQLADQPADLPPHLDAWPKLSLVIPARNEASTEGSALRSRLADDYPDLHVVFVDDRSQDETGAIARRIAAKDDRVTVVRVNDLPTGWLGKVNALHEGMAEAVGEWVLFTDADIHFAPGTLHRAVAYAEAHDLGMLAVMPELEAATFATEAALSVFIRVVAATTPPYLVEDPSSSVGVGYGAFNLVRRSAFETTPGFAWLRMEAAEDIGLGVMMKACGFRCANVGGRGSVRVLFYRDVAGLWRGMEKNSLAVTAPLWLAESALVLAFLGTELAPLAALVLGLATRRRALAAIGASGTLALTAATIECRRADDGHIVEALAWPLGSVLFTLGVLRAFWLSYRRGGVVWRDTFYPNDIMLAGARVFAPAPRQELARRMRARSEQRPSSAASDA